MSTIPNSAIPHAVDHDTAADEAGPDEAVAAAKDALGGLIKGVEDFARDVGERLKSTPKGVAIAAGAVAVGGLVAAAAVPLVRAARKPEPQRKRTVGPRPKRATRARKPKGDATA